MADTTNTPENYTPPAAAEPTVTAEVATETPAPEYDQTDGSFH